jgi:hypothetical protein
MFFSILMAAFVAEVPLRTESPMKFYPSYAEVHDASSGKTVPLKPVKIRKPGRFWMFVESPRRIEFTLRREPDKGFAVDRNVREMQFNFIQVECDGQHRRRWRAPGEKGFTYKWDSPHSGFYTLDFDPGANASLVPVSANVPFALETEDAFEHLADGGFCGGAKHRFCVCADGNNNATALYLLPEQTLHCREQHCMNHQQMRFQDFRQLVLHFQRQNFYFSTFCPPAG